MAEVKIIGICNVIGAPEGFIRMGPGIVGQVSKVVRSPVFYQVCHPDDVRNIQWTVA
jgi:hypothetical protein